MGSIEIIALYIGELNNIKDKLFNFSSKYRISKNRDKFKLIKINDIELIDKKQLLIGKNGAGKTTLLNALNTNKTISNFHKDILVFLKDEEYIFGIFSSNSINDYIHIEQFTNKDIISDYGPLDKLKMSNGQRWGITIDINKNNELIVTNKQYKTPNPDISMVNVNVEDLTSSDSLEIIENIISRKWNNIEEIISIPQNLQLTLSFKENLDFDDQWIDERFDYFKNTPPFMMNILNKEFHFQKATNNEKLVYIWDSKVLTYILRYFVYIGHPMDSIKKHTRELYEYKTFDEYNENFNVIMNKIEKYYYKVIKKDKKTNYNAIDNQEVQNFKAIFSQNLRVYNDIRTNFFRDDKINVNINNYNFIIDYEKTRFDLLKKLLHLEDNEYSKNFFTHYLIIQNNLQSNGTKKLIQLIMNLEKEIIKNDVILIDEIDAFLYPELSRNLIYYFYKLFEKNNIKQKQIFFTSHSPFIISDFFINQVTNLDDNFDESKYFASNFNKILSEDFIMGGLVGAYATEIISNLANFSLAEQIYIIENVSDPILSGLLKEKYIKKLINDDDDELLKEKNEKTQLYKLRKWIDNQLGDYNDKN